MDWANKHLSRKTNGEKQEGKDEGSEFKMHLAVTQKTGPCRAQSGEASLDTSRKRGLWAPRPPTSMCIAEHRQLFKRPVQQALCTFRKSLWRDLEYFIVHFDLLPSVLCSRD